MQDKLTVLIGKLDKWLGSLYSDLLKLQANALKMKSSLDPESKAELFIPFNSLVAEVSQLKKFLEDQREALMILKRSPPGMAAGIIDFLYSVVVDPSSSTQKEDYYKKLRNLDKSYRGTEQIGSELGTRAGVVVDETAQNVASEWINSDILKLSQLPDDFTTDFKSEVRQVMKQANLAVTQGETVSTDSLIEYIETYLENPLDSQKILNTFFQRLEKNLLQDKDKKVRDQVAASISQIYQSLTSSFKRKQLSPQAVPLDIGLDRSSALNVRLKKLATSTSDIVGTIKSIQENMNKYYEILESNVYLNELDNVIKDISATDPKSQLVIEKYDNYVNELFNPHMRSVSSYLTKIKGHLETILAIASRTNSKPSDGADSKPLGQ